MNVVSNAINFALVDLSHLIFRYHHNQTKPTNNCGNCKQIKMYATNLILLALCIMCTCHAKTEVASHTDEKDETVEDILAREASRISTNDKHDKAHFEILGVFEPTEAYFAKHAGSNTVEKRSRRPMMRCIRFNWATRKCSRYALVGFWMWNWTLSE